MWNHWVVRAYILAERLRRDAGGVSTIEYAALAFAVIAAVAGVAVLLGGGINNLFGNLNNRMANIT